MRKEGIHACHGTNFEVFSETFDMYPFSGRAVSVGTGKIFSLYWKLANDLFTCEKFLLPKTAV